MNRLRAGSLFWCLGLLLAACLPAGRAFASMLYSDGPLLSGPRYNVYFIWYGDNWSGNTATSDLPSFISNLSGSSYMNMVTTYSATSSLTSTTYTLGNQVNLAGQAFVTSGSSAYYGADLNGSQTAGITPGGTYTGTIEQVVNATISAEGWSGTQNIYDVLTSTGITVSGFNDSGSPSFCGWHYSSNWGGTSLGTQYGFIGDPTNTGCYQSTHNSPDTTNVGADNMTSTIAHELFETVTDPTGRGWFAGSSEVADLCQNQFGTVPLNGTNYDLQEMWLNQGAGSCALSYSSGLAPTPEPASLALLLPGLIGLAAVRWRHRLGGTLHAIQGSRGRTASLAAGAQPGRLSAATPPSRHA